MTWRRGVAVVVAAGLSWGTWFVEEWAQREPFGCFMLVDALILLGGGGFLIVAWLALAVRLVADIVRGELGAAGTSCSRWRGFPSSI